MLFITNIFLDTNSGGTFASRAFANAFAELADECYLLYPDRDTNITGFIHSKYQFKGVLNKYSKLKKIYDIYLGKIHRFYRIGIQVVESFQPDLVVFDNSRCSADLIKMIKKLNIKIITIHHNYEIEYYLGTPPSILWRLPFMYFMKRAENNAVNFSDLNLTLTDQDTILLRRNYDKKGIAKFAKIGCFESKYIEYKPFQQRNHDNLNFIITGSLDSYQTEVALIPFLEDLYPLLLKKYPKSNLIITGSNPSARLKNTCKSFSNIQIISNPINIDLIIDNADIYLCPISVGGGMKLRILDGLKSGIPILAHNVSERGYDEFKELGMLFSYSDKESFILSLDELIKKHKCERFLGEKIVEKYQLTFSFLSGIERLKNILKTNNIF